MFSVKNNKRSKVKRSFQMREEDMLMMLDNVRRHQDSAPCFPVLDPYPAIRENKKFARAMRRLLAEYARLKEYIALYKNKKKKVMEIVVSIYEQKTKTGFKYSFTKKVAYGKHRGEGPLMLKKLKTVLQNGRILLTEIKQNNQLCLK